MLILGIAAGGAGYVYDQRREEYSKTLIKAGELKFHATVLRAPPQYSTGWEVAGKVTNLSDHRLAQFGLRITIEDCPEADQCIVVGESEETIWTEVPPKQMRAFADSIFFQNMPKLTNWRWYYQVTAVRADID